MKYSLLALTVLCLLPHMAQAKRLSDLSMTPGEMMEQHLNVNQPGTPLGAQPVATGTPGAAPWGTGNNGIPPAPGGQGASGTNYMDGYCDPNFKPMVSKNTQYAAMASCLEQQKTQACQMYRALPDDARVAINNSINCVARVNAAAENGEPQDEEDSGGWGFGGWGNTTTNTPTSCVKADVKRLELLKNYWGKDQNTAYALVFLPDLVMDNSGTCLKR